MPTEKIDRELHRAVVVALMDGIPKTLNELEAMTGYRRNQVSKHIRDNMNVVQSKRQLKPGQRGGQTTTYTLPYEVLRLKCPSSMKSRDSKHPDIV